MIELLNDLDTNLFLFLNNFNSDFWDVVMWRLTRKYTWVPLYLGILFLLFRKYRWQAVIPFLFIIAAVTVTDQVSGVMKYFFERPRPSHEPALEGLVHNYGKKGGPFGFVSAHAANSFVLAFITVKAISLRWYSWVIIAWAIIHSYTRIYLGVHYPGDILGGTVLGLFTGWVFYNLMLLTCSKWLNHGISDCYIPSAVTHRHGNTTHKKWPCRIFRK